MKNVRCEHVDYGWVREKVEEDHDFIYRIYILRFFWIVGEIWKQWDFYIVSIIINSKSGLIKL